jgi:acyl carrier protein
MNNDQKLFQAVADVFQVDAAVVNESSSPDTIPKWDSLGIVHLVTELEQAFGVQFDILEIADFRNVAIIKSILAEKGVRF